MNFVEFLQTDALQIIPSEDFIRKYGSSNQNGWCPVIFTSDQPQSNIIMLPENQIGLHQADEFINNTIFAVAEAPGLESSIGLWEQVDEWDSGDPQSVVDDVELVTESGQSYIQAVYVGKDAQEGVTSIVRYQVLTIEGQSHVIHCAHSWKGTEPSQWPVFSFGSVNIF